MSTLKIRTVVASDLKNLKVVIDSSELFPSELLDDMIAGYLAGEEESIWLTADSDAPTFVVFCAPEKMTEGTWNLYLIAVHANLRGTGIGRQVMNYLERLLLDKGVRVLLVETSGLPEFERTRHFYLNCNYTLEARIRDFYQAGEDKIVFWKALG
ncbi:MAG: GNAT family N-acetyltransferase [Bacteroidota bacterium]